MYVRIDMATVGRWSLLLPAENYLVEFKVGELKF